MAAVALHSTAEVPRFRQGACARKDRHAPGVDSDSGAGGENHLRRMAEKAEAGDVGRAGGAKEGRASCSRGAHAHWTSEVDAPWRCGAASPPVHTRRDAASV